LNKIKFYISGRMTGNEKYYEEDFKWIENGLSELEDIEPINPLKFDYSGNDWSDYIIKDIEELKKCDVILLMNGQYPIHKSSKWKKSYGAQIERIVAKKYGLKVFYGWRHFKKWYNKLHKYDGVNNG